MPLSPFPIRAAAVGALLLSAACANTAGAVQSAGQASVAQALCGMGFSSIPMRALPSGHHIADVTLNGQPGTFVVDTGAGRTVIHAPYAQSFGLSPGPELKGGRAVGTGGEQAIQQFATSDFRVGGTRTALNTIYGTNLGNVVQYLDAFAGKPVQGIVGQDVMRSQNAIVDIQQSRLYLRPVAGERARCS